MMIVLLISQIALTLHGMRTYSSFDVTQPNLHLSVKFLVVVIEHSDLSNYFSPVTCGWLWQELVLEKEFTVACP